MTERLDKQGLTAWMDKIEADLEELRRFQRQTRNEVRGQTAILERIAAAVESIDAKTRPRR